MRNLILSAAVVFGSLIATSASAVGDQGVLTGDVVDGETGDPVVGVMVTAKGVALQGELASTTDAQGRYRIDGLPAGLYTLSFQKELFSGEPIAGIAVRANATLREDAVMYHEGSSLYGVGAATTDVVKVTASSPVIDVGSTQTGGAVNQDMIRRLPMVAPGGKNGGQRGFEGAAVLIPQVQNDAYGASINGTTSPENQYVVDGVSVNNTAYGYNGTPLSLEFIDEVSVLTGGYLPEYGRATGGLLDVSTKSGGNQFHGSAFGNFSPGQLEGIRTIPPNEGASIRVNQRLNYVGDLGFELGGPVLQDRLWFFTGANLSRQSFKLDRQLYSVAGQPLSGTLQTYEAESTSLQAIAKLTWLVTQDNRLTFSVFATPTVSGGGGKYGITPDTGRPESLRLEGQYSALAHIYRSGALDANLKWDAALLERKLRFDTSIGWHHEIGGRLPSDGSTIDSGKGLSALPRVQYRRSNPFPRSITEFEDVPKGAGCDATLDDGSPACPVTEYAQGGPDFINDAAFDSLRLNQVTTYLLDFFGIHVIKAGIGLGYASYDNMRSYSGGRRYRENRSGTTWSDNRQFGFLTGPDQPEVSETFHWTTRSLYGGAFVQDSWTAFDLVTLNVGVRWDNEYILASDNSIGLALPNQLSPRAGLIFDPFQSGRMKLFGSYARYYQSVPLDIADRASSSEPQITSVRPQGANCDPTTAAQKGCDDDGNRLAINGTEQPDQKWIVNAAGRTAVDPALQPSSSDEIVVGAEGEVFRDARIGVTYTKRWLNVAIEDMSRDEANTYFIGNPGFGAASDFDKATRDYDSLTFLFHKQWADNWLLQGSYTFSYLRGNYAGLFRPETEQLNPNINSDFDLKSLTVNRTGPLPFDRTHQLKAYGAKTFEGAYDTAFTIGGSASAFSGAPVSYLGSHPLYGSDEVFVLPRGAAGRTEWNFSTDVHGGFQFQPIKGQPVELSVDIFNLLNWQAGATVDQTYTEGDVNPLTGCNAKAPDPRSSCTTADLRKVRTAEGGALTDADKNPNFGQADTFQAPRTVRVGLRWSF